MGFGFTIIFAMDSVRRWFNQSPEPTSIALAVPLSRLTRLAAVAQLL
jgi:hypothetical protein